MVTESRRSWRDWYAEFGIETPHWMLACQCVLVCSCVAGIFAALYIDANNIAIGCLLALVCFGVGTLTQSRIHSYRMRSVVAVAGKRKIAVYIEGEDTSLLADDAIAAITKLGLYILQHNHVPQVWKTMTVQDIETTVVTHRAAAQQPVAAGTTPAVASLPEDAHSTALNEKPELLESIADEDESANGATVGEYVWGNCSMCNRPATGNFAVHGDLLPLCDDDARKMGVLPRLAATAKA